MMQYVLALWLALVAPVWAGSDFAFSTSSAGGGAATSIISGTTTVTGGTNEALCYVNATGKIVCDATSPTWDAVTKLFSLDQWSLWSFSDGSFYVFKNSVDPNGNSGFLFFHDATTRTFDVYGGTGGTLSLQTENGEGPALASTTTLDFATNNYTRAWSIDLLGNFTSVGAGRNLTASGNITALNVRTTPVAIASLPTCNAGAEGTHAAVNDSNAVSFTVGIGAAVANGGTTHVPVYCDGTNWRIG